MGALLFQAGGLPPGLSPGDRPVQRVFSAPVRYLVMYQNSGVRCTGSGSRTPAGSVAEMFVFQAQMWSRDRLPQHRQVGREERRLGVTAFGLLPVTEALISESAVGLL